MKKITIFFLFSCCLITACGSSNKDHTPDSLPEQDSVKVAKAEGKYQPVPLNSEAEVRDFLAFKKFSNSSGWIAFNRDGGVIDNEAFTLTGIDIESPLKETLKIEIPKMKLSGKFTLEQNEEGVTLTDVATGTVYKLTR